MLSFIKPAIRTASLPVIGALVCITSVCVNAQTIQPRTTIKLPPATVSPSQAKPSLTLPDTQPNWSLTTRSPHNASNNPVAPGATAPITIEVSNTREGTLKRPIRLAIGSRSHGNYRDFGTFALDTKGTKRTFTTQLKIPANVTQDWYQTTARLLEANGQPLQDYNGTNTASVSIRVEKPQPKPDPKPARVAGAAYDWSGDTQACQTVTNFMTDAWQYMDDVVALACTGIQIGTNPANASDLGKTFRDCTANASKYTAGVNKAVSEYNKLVGNSWATLGPRGLRYGVDHKGTVVFPGDRTFVSVVPSRKDTLNLRMRELDGKGKVEVIVCAKGQSGGVKRLNKTFGFNYSAESTHNKPRQDESMIIGDVRDKFVTVILKTRPNPSLNIDALRKLQYTLNVKEHR
jgi:hypothetical protein